jgi:DNA-binding NarL/FixJ family response regulator
MTIRILIVDDQPAIRRGLRMRFALEPDLVVVGEAGDGQEALERACDLHPDVVVTDLVMPGMDGIAATHALRQQAPESAVIILSLWDNAAVRADAHRAGAAGFTPKHEGVEALITCIRDVHNARPPSPAESRTP